MPAQHTTAALQQPAAAVGAGQLQDHSTTNTAAAPAVCGPCRCVHQPINQLLRPLALPATHTPLPTCTYCVASRLNWSLTGHAGVVSSSVNDTAPEPWSMLSDFTKPHDTMSSPKSGSMMRRSCPSTASLAARASACVCESSCGRGGSKTSTSKRSW